MTHIMLDLETWGKKPGCDIRSIGAVVFDPVEGLVYNSREFPDCEKQFYVACENPKDDDYYQIGKERKYPLTRDPKTINWWNEQSPEAQNAFKGAIDLRQGCLQFADWLIQQAYPSIHIYQSPHFTPVENVKIWANGPQFDVSILEAVFDAVGLPVPWHYRAPRDFRTITDAAGMTHDDFSNYGDAHNALHDAIAQAMTVCEAYKRLGLSK